MQKTLICLFLFALTAFVKAQNLRPLIQSGELIKKGVDLHDEGKYKEALRLYEQVSRSDTNYTWALYEMGLSYTADSQFNKAKATYQEALELKADPEREPEIYTNYGSLLDDMGDADGSLKLFETAIKKYPSYSPLYLNKGTTLIKLKRYQEAEAVLKHALLIDPYSYSSHYLLSLTALQQGKIIPSFLGFIAYLMMSPEGRYQKNCVNLMNTIARNKEELKAFMASKKDDDPYQMVEQIVLARIALDKNYKPIIQLDDAISRQIQVLFEKMEYDEENNDFWMQYYIPLFRKIFAEKKFETFINHIFSGISIDQIQNYNKRNKKENQALIDDIIAYLNLIQNTREINYTKREKAEIHYPVQNGKVMGKGKWKNNGDTYLGSWEFYYPAGNLRSKGSYNEAGEREGEWTYYYFTGNLRAKEKYRNGKLEGETVFYHPNGNLSSKENYANDLSEGEAATFYQGGYAHYRAQYKNGKFNGERKTYSSRGLLESIEAFRNDTLNGEYKTYYENGQLKSTAVYQGGKLNGNSKGYHENGKLSFEGAYLKDNLTGTWKRYHENGKLKSVAQYENGELNGPYEEYHYNGNLYTKYQAKKGKLNGEVSYYDEDGKLFVIDVFDNSSLKSARYFDKQGKEISKSEMKGRKLLLTALRPDGTKRFVSTYNEKGETEGTETYFYSSGKLSETNEYQKGELNGKSISYHPNGRKNVELNFVKGQKDGYYQSYYTHGQLQNEGWYKENLAEGEWLYYDELGNLTMKANYYNDESDGYKEEFYPNGKKEYETKYNNGLIEKLTQWDSTGKKVQELNFPKGSGRITTLNPAGKVYTEGSYVNGYLEGAYKFYFPDGTLESIQFYKNGLNDSIYKSHYYGGAVNVEGKYSMGDKTGTWKFYRKDGTLSYVETYENGVENGKAIYYYPNGKIDRELFYENGEREGISKKFTPDGIFMYQLTYHDNLPVSYTYPDKSGKLLPEILLPGGSGKVKTFYANGNVSTSFEYADGKLIGPDMFYYPDGKTWTESREDYGNTEGISKTYYPNGQVKTEINYLHNNAHGPYKEYNEKGTVTEEGNYYNGSYHGTLRLYDETGKLKQTRIYYYGRLISVKK